MQLLLNQLTIESMKQFVFRASLFTWVFFCTCISFATPTEDWLKKTFPTATVTSIPESDHFKECYQVVLQQFLDHAHPKKGTFDQYIYVSHIDPSKPVVLVTEGYSAYQTTYELSSMMECNQVIVEYRFYGKSRPTIIPWEYLTNDQAIGDYHSIVSAFKTYYTGKWISTGISKGGETVLIYKSKYPTDVDVAVPYVAPLINGTQDPRTIAHIQQVGDEACRKEVIRFQRLLLERRQELLLEIDGHIQRTGATFHEVPTEEALEYAALEFSFSFWQWGGSCAEIPPNDASASVLFDYMNRIVGIDFYNDQQYEELLPSYYQHHTELGYYGFDLSPVSDLLQVVKSATNLRFAPKNVAITYNPNYIKKVREFVEQKGDRILYIYGGNDTWGTCSPNPASLVDALKMVLAGGSHATRINDFPANDRMRIYDQLEKWLGEGIIIHRL